MVMKTINKNIQAGKIGKLSDKGIVYRFKKNLYKSQMRKHITERFNEREGCGGWLLVMCLPGKNEDSRSGS